MKDRTIAILLAISIFIAGVAVGRMINIVSNNETNTISIDPVVVQPEKIISPPKPAISEDDNDDYEDDEDEDDD